MTSQKGSFQRNLMQSSSLLYITQRQYKRGLEEVKRIIEIELATFDNEGNYTRNAPPSIYNNLYPLVTLSAKFNKSKRR